ncbi:hypothetical protein ASE21_21375 [Flavobacterium sp. Root901]|uniref:IS3 family transposase n=1 Tax=Flavobacterium sp. Root901 TaxID=1736605 RepID=UPI0007152E66|nr:IS3 family transposase [Flavobacterium sp. Root901]KRD12113.1 hypothetical protein ASE21_21375 [Flavobacterium sp. Root901]
MKKSRKEYDFAFKEKAVRLSYQRKCLSELEKELDLYAGALSQWRKEYKKYTSENSQENNYLKSNLESQKIKNLEKKIKQSDLKFEILKKAQPYLYQNNIIIFNFILTHEKIYSIKLICEALDLCRNTYLVWKRESLTETQKRKLLIKKEITSIFYASKQRYGRVRIMAELQNLGYKISTTTVNKYMKELNLSNHVKIK